ncbi:MAG: hypothetical protein CMB95_07205 [Flavobacteriaceae bacterium]|nr:hypothetical protein [Flavobacteriaceae bacterium]|tara:strand:+ start:2775 stop:3575 length:801 start_codon:yes stop_codon:yes gene_type:complete
MTVKISLIMSTARKQAGLHTLLKSISKQTIDLRLVEFILVDKAYDERKENYLDVLKSFWDRDKPETALHNVKYIKDESQKGFVAISSARNKGVENAEGEWIVSIDDRTILYPNTLELHLKYLEAGYDGAAGFSDFHHTDGFAISEPDKVDERFNVPGASNGLFAARHFYGYNMGFTKKSWKKVKGFDETFDGTYGWEDIDFGMRIYNAGGVIKLAPECKVLQVRDKAHHNTFDDKKAPTTIVAGRLKWKNDKCHRLTLMNQRRMRW